MKGFLAVARREIVERRLVLAAAAFASLIPLALPLVRGLSGTGALEARSWAALLLCVAFSGGIAIGLGATMLVPAIVSRRIAFDFARPLSAFAIWGGRLAATLMLAVATALIVWIPASLAGARFPGNEFFAGESVARSWPVLALGGLTVLFCLFHALALLLRSGSRLLALDAVLGLLTGFGVTAALGRLPLFLAHESFLRVVVALATVAAVALLAAGYASAAFGRTDVGAAHRALSLTLWTLVGSAVVGVNVYASWVMAAGPADLEKGFWVSPAAKGPRVEVSGKARGAEADFLFDTASGRFSRTPIVRWLAPVISLDGKRAAWLHAGDRGGPFPVWTWRLDDPKASPKRTRLLLNGYPSIMALSADGSRLATVEEGALSIYDLESERNLASLRIPANDRERMQGLFVANGRFRMYRTQKTGRIDILELEVASRAGRHLGTIEGLEGLRFFAVGPAGDRLVTLEEADRRVRLFDGHGGTLLATLAQEPAESRWPEFLSDGRIVLTERLSRGPRLRVFRPNGEEEATIALPPGRYTVLGAETAPGQLVVGIGDEAFHYASWLADIDGRTIRGVAEDLRPVSSLFDLPAVGSEATRLFYGPGGALVRFDPLTGQRRVLLGGP